MLLVNDLSYVHFVNFTHLLNQLYRTILGYRPEYKPAEAAKSELSAQAQFELPNLT